MSCLGSNERATCRLSSPPAGWLLSCGLCPLSAVLLPCCCGLFESACRVQEQGGRPVLS